MKHLVLAGDLYIFQHDLERYINHCKDLNKKPSIKGFKRYVLEQHNKQVN